jgi:hypothetical protein
MSGYNDSFHHMMNPSVGRLSVVSKPDGSYQVQTRDLAMCAHCECDFPAEEALILDAEINAPYTASLYCSEECKQSETEDRYEHAYSGGAR